VVFAQTYIPDKNGKTSHEGINAFLVKIRDEKGNCCDGVTIDDMGSKMGQNGVDNARIMFKNVKVGKSMLLDNITKLNQLSPNTFQMVSTKDVTTKRQRFLAASNRLLSGRICLSCLALSESKMCLLTLQRFSQMRLSNGKKGLSDTPITEYQLYQNQITPLMVKTFVYNVGLIYIRNIYGDYIVNAAKNSTNPLYQDSRYFNQIVRLCCSIKPLLAWHTNQVGNICRERSGGQGYLSINRIEQTVSLGHATITAEGDSAVLMQKVSKEYVDDYSKNRLFDNVLPKFNCTGNSSIDDFKKVVGNVKDFLSLHHLVDLMKARELILLHSLAKGNKENSSSKEKIYNYWMNEASNNIQELAEIFGERICMEYYVNDFMKKFSNNSENMKKLEKIAMLFSLLHIRKYLSFFLIHELINVENSKNLKDSTNDLIRNIFVFSNEILDGFGVPDELVIAPIANDYKEYYKVEQTDGEFTFLNKRRNDLKQVERLRPKF